LDEKDFREILDSISDGVYFVDTERRITFWNKGAERISGYSAEEVIGSRCSDNILIHTDDTGRSLCLADCPISEAICLGCSQAVSVFLHHKDGHRIPIEVRVSSLINNDGETTGAFEVFNDATANVISKERIEELENLAYIDALTGIANRRFIEQTLIARHDESRRNNWSLGILFFDIDGLKKINDSHGHDVGDKVLRMVARTIYSNARSYDLIGRWGGEEFLYIAVNIEKEKLFSIAERFRNLIRSSQFDHELNNISTTVSIGGTIVGENETAGEAVKRADQAMYKAKFSGKNAVVIE
jgi:diguanylate cyclase (GGDEF)-like protein/PAS domain S-box-containing protein